MGYDVNPGSYIRYSSNNSGGSWWLEDRDWEILEEAGWVVEWLKDDPYWSSRVDENGKWLGTKALGAKRYGVPLGVAMAEFAALTSQFPDDEGCSCCGQPHSFGEYNENGEWI